MNTRAPARIAAGLFSLSLLVPAAGHAATQTVTSLADDGSAGTLRSRIAAAAAGDTIAFTPTGTVTLLLGELLLDKNLILTGPGITVRAAGSSRVLRTTAGTTVTIQGSGGNPITIREGSATNGGGILSAGTLTVANATITASAATTGGGLYVEPTAGTTTLTGVTISGNTAQDGAGVANGTYLSSGSSLSLTGCVVTGNTASGGGPFATNEGGGIRNFGDLSVTDSDLASNVAGVGGAIYSVTASPDSLDVSGTDVTDNIAKLGGGLFVLGDAAISASSTVVANTATGGAPFDSADGGGILNYGTLVVSASEVSGNAARRGGGVYSIGVLDLDSAQVLDNEASDGGPISAANRGGGVFSSGDLTASGSTVLANNTAGFGGGLFQETRSATAVLTGVGISANEAISGAGIANGDSQAGGGTVTLVGCDVLGNGAVADGSGPDDDHSGGGVLNFGELSVTGGQVSGNRAGSGAGILNEQSPQRVCAIAATACVADADCAGPGDSCRDRGHASLTEVLLEDNRAGLGGGLLNRASMEVAGSTLARNRADLGGGVYNDGDGVLVLVNDTLTGNLAGTSVDPDAFTVVLTVVTDRNSGPNVYNNAGAIRANNCTVNAGAVSSHGGLFLVSNSVLAGSADDENCGEVAGLVSEGYNLDSGSSCGFAVAGDVQDGTAALLPLAMNGGPTPTHRPGAGSLAVNTAHPAAPGAAGACEASDQRGAARSPAGDPRCDKGAFERTCGNGVTDALESCDDGNLGDGDGCDSNCLTTGCGNGVVATQDAGFPLFPPEEVCDDGNVANGDYCASDCLTVNGRCGDGIVQAGLEACDASGAQTALCEWNCTSPSCGDGILNAAAGEDCDDANLQDGDGCTERCLREYCGDGVVNNGDEQCDDTNLDNNDGCTNGCRLSSCGDGNRDATEACDDANNLGGDGCSPVCSLEACGNSVLDAGETCDDGALVDGDGCDSNCSPTGCGNGVATSGETCDDGNTEAGDYCSPDCSAVTGSCGNSAVEAAVEGCDDGNHANGDGCDARCGNESCGDGLVNDGPPLGIGEACDDGNTVPGDYCSADCGAVTGSCGDGVVQANEDCDDGNDVDGDGCTAVCADESCGDGVVNDTGEACDDGNNLSGDYCAADCSAVTGSCGDGVTQTRAEGCDDGRQCSDLTTDCTANAAACAGILDGACAPRDGGGLDTCDSNCTPTACGNGVVVAPEACDDGNRDSLDYCADDCSASTGSCGDSIVQSAPEACDSGAVQTADCEGGCTLPVCGDGILNTLVGEACDDGRQCADGRDCTADASTCAGTGDGSCRPRDRDYCGANCRAATGVCGDGLIQPAVEQCDDGLVQSVACETNCQLPRCGDGVLNTPRGEQCDDGNDSSDDACTAVCETAICGDGLVWVGTEDCDDSGESYTCDADCTAATCGDGLLNTTAGENCEDGSQCSDGTDCTANASACTGIGDGSCAARDGDGCSATCGEEGIQSPAQQDCIVGMNKVAARVAMAQAMENTNCVKLGRKGPFDDVNAQVCLTLDRKDRVGRARRQSLADEAELCSTLPGFGFSDSVAGSDGAVAAALGLTADLFGADLNAAIVTRTQSEDGHRCQSLVAKASSVLLKARLRVFYDCKRARLKDGSLDSGADLAQVCFGEIAADERGRVASAAGKFTKTRAQACDGVDLGVTFPGECAGLGGAAFDACAGASASCRTCRLLNAADRLVQDCDLFDDANPNGSCP